MEMIQKKLSSQSWWKSGHKRYESCRGSSSIKNVKCNLNSKVKHETYFLDTMYHNLSIYIPS